LEDFTSPTEIGADSLTDKKLVVFARKWADTNDYSAVFVATDDGGIMLDIAHISKSCDNIAIISKETNEQILNEFVWKHIAIHTDGFLELISGARTED